jgi:hypothetical protein
MVKLENMKKGGGRGSVTEKERKEMTCFLSYKSQESILGHWI